MELSDITLVRSYTHFDGTAWFFTLTVGGRRVYESPRIWLDEASVKGVVADVMGHLGHAPCTLCGLPADFVQDFGNLERDQSDFMAFCSYECAREAAHELV